LLVKWKKLTQQCQDPDAGGASPSRESASVRRPTIRSTTTANAWVNSSSLLAK